MFGLPIRGPLHPNDWVRPPGNSDFRVTQDALQHTLASPGHPSGPMALDIGDGNPDADDLIAVHAGTVAQALTFGSANLSIEWSEGSVKWRAVYAHNLLPHPVKVGQSVSLGQLVGRVGKTGASAAHLHIQIGYLSGSTWVWQDPWPLIQGDDMDPSFTPTPNRTVMVNAGARHRLAPTLDPATIAIASDPGGPLGAGAPGAPLALMGTVIGAPANGSTLWYVYWRPEPKKPYYLHSSTCGPLIPWEQAGHSDQELKEARAEGIDAAAKSAAATQ